MSESSTPKIEQVSGSPVNQRTEKGFRHLFADAEFNEVSGTLFVAGTPVTVEPRPLRLLAELLRRVNEVVSKEELFEAVWAGRVTVDHVLANAVSKLRGALGEQAGARVVNIPRVGYRLDGPVRRVVVGAAQRDLIVGDPVPGREAYVLERALGPAGGSQVWLARHAKLGQAHVFKFAEDESRLAAIKREYTLFRVLQAELGPRDEFVRVLDTQFAVKPYFLECEYGGVNLLEWAELEGRLTAMPIDEQLGLFQQMARAVAAAHSVGVLHKDLKPANVLIAGEPGSWKVRLTDFGSGRLVDPDQIERLQLTAMGMTQTGLTDSDSRSGTLMYMAPELLSGQSATTQSDVYALGVMLYQLLARDLRRPMTTGWPNDIADELLVEDIAAATQGRPGDRIVSVGDLAERLSNLASRREARLRQAEQARLASLLAAADARRRTRRPWVIAAFASLLVGIAASLWLYRQASVALTEARAQAAKARAISDFLTKDVLQSADVTTLGTKKSLLLGDILDRASRSAANRFPMLPATEAQIRMVLGELYYKAASNKEAEAEFRAASTLFAKAIPPSTQQELGAKYALARALVAMSKLDEASAVLDAADAALAASRYADLPELALASARARSPLHAMTQRYAEGEELALAVVRMTDAQSPDDLGARFAARRSLVVMRMRNGKLDEAQLLLDEMTKLPFSPETVGAVVYARGQMLVGRLLQQRNQPALAEVPLTAALDALNTRLGPDEIDVANLQEELGRVQLDQGKFEEARRSFGEAHRVHALRQGEQHQTTRIAALNLALVGLNDGRPADALGALRRDRPWFVANMGGERSPVVQYIDFFQVRALLDLGEVRPAEQIVPRLDARVLDQATKSEWDAMLSAERGRILVLKGQRNAGLALLRPSVAVMKTSGMQSSEIRRYEQALARASGERIGAQPRQTAP